MMNRFLNSAVLALVLLGTLNPRAAHAGWCRNLLGLPEKATPIQTALSEGEPLEIEIETELPPGSIQVSQPSAEDPEIHYSLSAKGWALIAGGAALSGVVLTAVQTIPHYGNLFGSMLVFLTGTFYSSIISPVIKNSAPYFDNWMARNSILTQRKSIHPNNLELHQQAVDTSVVYTTSAEGAGIRISQCRVELRTVFWHGLQEYRRDPTHGYSDMVSHWASAFYGKRLLFHDLSHKTPILVSDFQNNFLKYFPERQRLHDDLLAELQATDKDLLNPNTAPAKRQAILTDYRKLLGYWILGIDSFAAQ